MRNKVAAVVCVLVMALMLSACSEGEVAFFRLLNDFGAGAEGHIEGSFEVSFDREGLTMRSNELFYSVLLDYGKHLVEEAGRNWEEEGYDELFDEEFGEYKDISYDWNEFAREMDTVIVYYMIDTDYHTMSYHIEVTVSYNGQFIDFGEAYYSMEDGLFISGKTLKNVIHYLKPYYDIPKSVRDKKSVFLTKDFQEGLEHLIEENMYIHVWNGTGGFLGSELLAMIYNVQNFQDQAPIELIEIYRTLIDCILNNEESFYGTVETSIQGIREYTSDKLDTYPPLNNLNHEIYQIDDETRKLISLFLETWKEFLKNDSILNPSLEDSEISHTIDKNGERLVMDLKGELQYKGNTLVTIHSRSEYDPKTTSIVLPENVLSAKQLYTQILEIEKKVNPAVRIFLSWNTETYMEVYDYWKAWYDYNRGDSDGFIPLEAGPGEELEWYYDFNYYDDGMFWDYEDRDYLAAEFNKKYIGLSGEGTYLGRELFNLEIHDGDLYVPLRRFCEMFGQELVWDTESMHFYAVVDGEKIDMNGFVKEGIYYVNAVEFEKMGFVVSYANSSWDKHYVSIVTPDQIIPYDEKDLDEWQRVH